MPEVVVHDKTSRPVLSVDIPGVPIDELWTPVDASAAGLVFPAAFGHFMLLGNLVIAAFNITWPATADGTQAIIGGLPFPAQNSVANCQMGGTINTTDAGQSPLLLVQSATRTCRLYTNANVAIPNSAMSGKFLRATLIYRCWF